MTINEESLCAFSRIVQGLIELSISLLGTDGSKKMISDKEFRGSRAVAVEFEATVARAGNSNVRSFEDRSMQILCICKV